MACTTISAQSFSDFKKSQSKSFNTYKDERDNAFDNYLKGQWNAYEVYTGEPLYEERKPKEITPSKSKITKPVGPKITIKIKKRVELKPEIEKIEPKQEPLVKAKDISFDFYGAQLEFDIPSGIKQANYYPHNQKGITSFFSSAASSAYDSFISEIGKVSKNMNLNDWGIYLLITKISDSIFTNQDNSKLLSWFIFNKMGYAVKVGLAKQHIVLMHYSDKIIYSTPNYSFSDKKYYAISNYDKGSIGRVFSYRQDYPGSTKPFDLSLLSLPKLPFNIKTKTLNFKQFGDEYSVSFEYNKNLIDFMDTYPQADYQTYFNAPMESKTFEDVALSLKKYIDGRKASDAMNFVLAFVQKSFKYERDNEQFGREKVMFAEETLFFDKSDCEDRAVLYTYLMKELFHVPVIGLKYKNHMSTAIYVPMDGDSVKVGSRKFIVADPTYVNATIGMSMPNYKSIKPQSYIEIGIK
ncbi:hypothetical protein [Candidatus Sulfurimonas marisnigri]|uniref:hypothetical protein n=1 Tax=Candidatus Sulfurimonas marisnigri TaxID=2740405 RepID=UPI001E43B23D|nr:hypothetical protein [Candidatus Sulfurimonas marisnigri]